MLLVTTNFLVGDSDEDWLKPPAIVAAASGVARVEAGQVGAVELHAIEVLVVDVLARLAAVAEEVEEAVLGVDLDDRGWPARRRW